MIAESEFIGLVTDLNQSSPQLHTRFWNHVARIANTETPLRDVLERVLKRGELENHIKVDMSSHKMELRCAVVLAVGYCVARPQLAKHMDTKLLIEELVKAPLLSSYNKQIAIKCVWAVANVKQTDHLAELAEDVMTLICNLLKHRQLKDDVAVHKEVLRLLDKMLLTAPTSACQFTYLSRWLVCVVNLTVNKLQLIREKAGGLLKKHMAAMLKDADNEVNRVIAQQLFSLSTVSNITKPTSWLLQELQQLAATGHSLYVMEVWVCLVHMTSKCILKKSAYSNELFSIPDYFTKHLTDDSSRIALLDSWVSVVDIYRSNNPEFFATSKQMKFFMTPFFAIKQPSLDVYLALVKSWWYLVVACHRLKYMNNFTAVLEPCIKTCFKHEEAGALVQCGADILYLLLDCTPPDSDLASIAPSSLNLADSYHSSTFLKYYEMLIRYKPNCNGLVLPMWGRLCDCVKGIPQAKSMLCVLETAVKHLSPINAMSMVESLSYSQIVTSHHMPQLARFMMQSCRDDDKLLSVHLTKLLKSVSFEDTQYLTLLSKILGFLSSAGESNEVRVQSRLSVVWQCVSAALAQYIEATGGQLNEGTRIEPQFPTTHNTVSFVFKFLDKSHDMPQSGIQTMCQSWERLVSLYIEHTSQSNTSISVTDQLISLLLDTYLDTILLYPLIYCSKVLVEESPVPQMTLLQSTSTPVFELVSSVLHRVHKESQMVGLSPPTLSLCIELCTSSWNLLTPGRVVPILTDLKSSYIGLVNQDKNYPPALQNIIQTSYTAMLTSVQKHVTFYKGPELRCLEDYLIYGLKHSKKLVRVATAKFWNSTFGIRFHGPYSEKLRAVIRSEAKRSALIVPSSVDLAVEQSHSQTTEMSDPSSKSLQVPVRGSFLGRKKNTVVENENVETAKPSTKPFIKARAATPTRATRSVHKRQMNEDSKECIYIPSSPKKQKILTKHQKEKIMEQRLDRNVPVMYNNLDINSQEPLMFDSNSQSQADITKSPEKKEESPQPKPVTPGFSSRKLLFLSPLPNKATASTAASQSVVAKAIAMLPTSSPETPDVPTSQSDQNNSPSDSEEDLYGDPPEEPDTQPPEPSITPPPLEREITDSGIELQITQPPPDDLGNDSFTPEDPANKGGMLSSVIKSVVNYWVPNRMKPTSLVIAPNSDTEKSDESKSVSTDTTPSEPKTSTDSTPLHSKSSTDSSPLVSHTSIKSTPLVPMESLLNKTVDTPLETPLVLVEDSLGFLPVRPTENAIRTVPDSIPPDVETSAQNALDLQTFSNEISFSDCSTALQSACKRSETKEAQQGYIGRRSSRRLTKRIKSEDLGIKESSSKFKRIKSSDDITSDVKIDPVQLMTPIKESENLSPLRKSVRPRKTSVKLRDESFINLNVPASILIDSSSSSTASDEKKDAFSSSNPKRPSSDASSDMTRDKTTISETNPVAPMKKRRGRPPKKRDLIEVPPPSSKRNKKAETKESSKSESNDIPVITIPDSQSEVSSQDSVQFVGELEGKRTLDETSESIKRKGPFIADTLEVQSVSFLKEIRHKTTPQVDPEEERMKDLKECSLISEKPQDNINIVADSQCGQDSICSSQVESIPDNQITIPDSQPVQSFNLEAETPSTTQNRKSTRGIGRKPKTSKHMAREEESPKDGAATQSKPRKSPRLSGTPPDSKNLITAYLSRSPKPSIDSTLNMSIGQSSLSLTERADSNQLPNSPTEIEKSHVDTNDTVKEESDLSKTVASSALNEPETLTLQSQPRVSDDSDSLCLQSLPAPTEVTSPQRTESIPSTSSQRRPRKQSQPRKSAAPSRKSLRLTSKSHQSPVQENQDTKSMDVGSKAMSQEREIIEISSQVLVPDSLQVQLLDSQTDDDNKVEHSYETHNVVKEIPSYQILSLDVSSSDKNVILSPVQKLSDLSTPQKSYSPPSSPTSVFSVETFGKPVAIIDFDLSHTPLAGLDTLEDAIEETVIDTEDVGDRDGVSGFENMAEQKGNTADESNAASPYKELEEYPESDVTQTFWPNSQELPSSPKTDDKIVLHTGNDFNIIPDSQAVNEDTSFMKQLVESRTKRSLKRKASIPANLPDVMQELVAVEMSQVDSATLEEEVKTPPKSLYLGGTGEPGTPTTPKTPSSILKRTGDAGSASPSLSRRHVTFGPLPESLRDPNEVTPRRYSKYRKSPAPQSVQSKVREPDSERNEEPIYPSLVHCTVRAHDIIRTLCTGFTLSQRNYNLSIVSSTIKTIGDLARLTKSQVEDYPFITPKLIQVRRHLKKYEAGQSPIFSVKSFLSETKARELTQKAEADSLESISEAEDKENRPVEVMNIESVTDGNETEETRTDDVAEPEENPKDGPNSDNTDSTVLDDHDKENIDPNQLQMTDSSKEEPVDLTKDTLLSELPTPSTEETIVSSDSAAAPETISLTELTSKDETVSPADEEEKPTRGPEEESPVTVIQNTISGVKPSHQPVITVGRPAEMTSCEQPVEVRETVEDSVVPEIVDEPNQTDSQSISQSEEPESSIDSHSAENKEEVAIVEAPKTDVGVEDVVPDSVSVPAVAEIVEDEVSFYENVESVVTPPADDGSQSVESDETQPAPTVICEDSPEDVGLTCHEELPLSLERRTCTDSVEPTPLAPASVTVIAETTSESSQSISQDIARYISDVSKDTEEIGGQIMGSDEESMEVEDSFKLDSIGSDEAPAINHAKESDLKDEETQSTQSDLGLDLPGLCFAAKDVTPAQAPDLIGDVKTPHDDVTTTTGEVINPLVDYPLTQPLVAYPLTQDLSAISFEDEIERIEEKLKMLADPERRHAERFKIIERLCRNSRDL